MTADADDSNPEVESLRERITDLVEEWDGIEQVTMFGLPSFTAHGQLFCVVSEQGLSLTRLPDRGREELATIADVVPFDADGRTVEGWATVPAQGLPDDETLVPFLRASYEAALAEADH